MKGAKMKKPSRFNFSTEDDDLNDNGESSIGEEISHISPLKPQRPIKEAVGLKNSISSLSHSIVTENKAVDLDETKPKDKPVVKKRKRGRPKKD